MVQRQAVSHQTNLHPLGQHCGHRDKQIWRRRKAVGCTAVVLREKDAVKAVFLHTTEKIHDFVVNLLAQASIVVSPGKQIRSRDAFWVTDAQEKPNLHGSSVPKSLRSRKN